MIWNPLKRRSGGVSACPHLKMKKRRRKAGTIALGILLAAVLAAAGFFAYRLWQYYAAYREDRSIYTKLRDEVLETDANEDEKSSVSETDRALESESESETGENDTWEDILTAGKIRWRKSVPVHVNWKKLKAINPDIIGWVYFEDLPQISYPVLQAADNDYYVHRTYDLSEDGSKAGSIFMDYRMASDFSAPYSIIYGHNVRDGSMLSDLSKLAEPEKCGRKQYYWILTPDGNYRYRVFSIFTCGRSADVFQQSFTGWGEDFTVWEQELASRDTAFCSAGGTIPLTGKDHVTAFSTCVPNSFNRTIVCGACISKRQPPDPEIAK